MIKLTFVMSSQLNAEDAKWIENAIAADPFADLKIFARMLANGSIGVLRVEEDAKGILLYQEIKHAGGNEIFIWKIAGEGILTHFGELVKELETFAKEKGCKWIGCSADHEGSKRVVERTLGIAPITALYRKEVENGPEDARQTDGNADD